MEGEKGWQKELDFGLCLPCDPSQLSCVQAVLPKARNLFSLRLKVLLSKMEEQEVPTSKDFRIK